MNSICFNAFRHVLFKKFCDHRVTVEYVLFSVCLVYDNNYYMTTLMSRFIKPVGPADFRICRLEKVQRFIYEDEECATGIFRKVLQR